MLSPLEASGAALLLGFNRDVDYPYFDEAIWPGLADRVPAFEALKMTSAWAGH
jgi:hypothetical protein